MRQHHSGGPARCRLFTGRSGLPARRPATRGAAENELRINAWTKQQELTSGKTTLWDYCFEMPDKNLAADQAIRATAKSGTVTHHLKVGGNDQFEIYDFPGGYAQRFDGVAPGGGVPLPDRT